MLIGVIGMKKYIFFISSILLVFSSLNFNSKSAYGYSYYNNCVSAYRNYYQYKDSTSVSESMLAMNYLNQVTNCSKTYFNAVQKDKDYCTEALAYHVVINPLMYVTRSMIINTCNG